MSLLRQLVLSCILLLLPSALVSSDTVRTRIVAPGVIHTEYAKPGPYTLDVLEIDIANPFVHIESYRPNGLTRTSVQARNNDRERHRVVGAINADFFSFETGWPSGNQVVNGKFVLGIGSVRSHLAIDTNKKPFIERLTFSGRVIAANGNSRGISGVNSNRTTGTLIFYTSYRGSATQTDGSGIECALELVGTGLVASDTIQVVVTQRSPSGNMAIPSNGGVLSGTSGAAATFLSDNLQIGDTVKVYLGFTANLNDLVQVVAGAGRILENGVNVSAKNTTNESIGSDFLTARHPRTFVGFNLDTSKVYFCTIDGRQTTSIGMSFNEMAAFLQSIGVWNAFNLDGGGSTTMVVRHEIVNSPSDPGGERSVANSLHVISTAPTGTLRYLSIEPKRLEVFQGNSHSFAATGTDEYYNPIALPSDVVWESDSQIGTIGQSGRFTALRTNDSGWVRVRWNNVRDSARVIVRELLELRVYPRTLVMVPGERLSLLVRGLDSDSNKVTLKNNQVVYTSPPALNVDVAGTATATSFGAGELNVRLDTVTARVPFNFSGGDTAILVDEFRDLFAWEKEVVNTDAETIQLSPSSDGVVLNAPAVKIQYSFPSASATLNLNTITPVSSRIDSFSINVYGDGGGHALRLYFRDKDGELFVISAPTPVNWSGSWRTVGFRLNVAAPVAGGVVDFPVTLTQLRVEFGTANVSGGVNQGLLYLDELQVHYPVRIVAPQVLFDFESGISGWLTPSQSNAAQLKGINISQSSLVWSSERAYRGAYSGKWTFIDDAGSSTDWDIRITRGQNNDLGSILRGSYIGAWIYGEGETNTSIHLVIRDGASGLVSGPLMRVRHVGWKLLGARLDEQLFTPYLISGRITDANNRFNGFRVTAKNADVSGQMLVYHIDHLVTSALTVPSGFTSFTASWNRPIVRLHWTVNSEISIDRYMVERAESGVYSEIGVLNAVGNTDTTQQYEFVDTPPAGATYQYRVRQMTNDGAQEVSPVLSVNTSATEVENEAGVLREFRLEQNYPNPFNPATVVSYELPVSSWVTLRVYTLLGQEIVTLVDGKMEAGKHQMRWDASALPSGVYVYRLKANGFVETKKMILIR